MTTRLAQKTVYRLRPQVVKQLTALGELDVNSPITPVISHLVRLRVSQINGCCFCINMHAHEARQDGVTQVRLDVLCTWQEAPCFSEQERAALGWAEALTNVATTGVNDQAYQQALAQFGEAGLMDLTAVVLQINSWNRIAIGFAFSPDIAAD